MREKTLQARAGMFGSLAFEAVRQKQHQAAEAFPFIFGAGDELIDDDLRHIPKIAELRLPDKSNRVGMSRL